MKGPLFNVVAVPSGVVANPLYIAVISIGVAGCIGIWLYGAYAMWRMRRSHGWGYLPFFSSNPEFVSAETLKWRKQFYLAMGGFIAIIVTMVLLGLASN